MVLGPGGPWAMGSQGTVLSLCPETGIGALLTIWPQQRMASQKRGIQSPDTALSCSRKRVELTLDTANAHTVTEKGDQWSVLID